MIYIGDDIRNSTPRPHDEILTFHSCSTGAMRLTLARSNTRTAEPKHKHTRASLRRSFPEADIGTFEQHFDPFDVGNAGRSCRWVCCFRRKERFVLSPRNASSRTEQYISFASAARQDRSSFGHSYCANTPNVSFAVSWGVLPSRPRVGQLFPPSKFI